MTLPPNCAGACRSMNRSEVRTEQVLIADFCIWLTASANPHTRREDKDFDRIVAILVNGTKMDAAPAKSASALKLVSGDGAASSSASEPASLPVAAAGNKRPRAETEASALDAAPTLSSAAAAPLVATSVKSSSEANSAP